MTDHVYSNIATKVAQLTSRGEWESALGFLMAENARQPDSSLEQLLVNVRLRAFRESSWLAPDVKWPPPHDVLPVCGNRLPEIEPESLTVNTLRSGILGNGALIVRGLMDAATVRSMRVNIDRSLMARHENRARAESSHSDPWYTRCSEVRGGPAQFFGQGDDSKQTSASVWAVDSPRTANQLIQFYHSVNLKTLLHGYFSEPASLSVKKWVLRRVAPDNGSCAGWHQDGRFLGTGIRTVNLWIALTDCGGDGPAPGMEIVAGDNRKIYETGTRGASFDWTVGPELVEEISKESPVLCPRFYPGDALFFDHHNLHRTAFGGDHTQTRYALESWFFAASRAPAKQMPVFL